jgi:hypothetical protein
LLVHARELNVHNGTYFDTFAKKLKLRYFLIILAFFSFVTESSGQSDTLIHRTDSVMNKQYVLKNVERNGVIMPEIQLGGVNIIGRPGGARKADYRRYERLIYNIKKVYPYARIVRIRLERVNGELQNITNERDRKTYLKTVEKDVFSEYEDDMRQMTITQGRLLIKLIDRETKNTSFDLIREYRGKISASFWQGIARIFGTNLKTEYDPDGDDLLIELIINEIDAGRM